MGKKKVIDIAKLNVITDAPAPPPPLGFTSPFKTIQEWLSYLCDTNQPDKPISEYHFSLVERSSNNLLALIGFNHYRGENSIAHRIEFKPATHMYFGLTEEEFGNLTPQQLRERVLNELIEFTKSDKFRSSFLAKGNSIRFDLAGEIWSK
jgi:hypothetical protein